MISDGLLYMLFIGVPVIIVVEFFCLMDRKAQKERDASLKRIKRELNRRHHPSNGEERQG